MHAQTLIPLVVSLSLAAPAGAGQRPQPPPAMAPVVREVARVNTTVIRSDRLDVALAALIPMESFHRNVSPARQAELRQQAIEGLIDDELQFQEGQRIGIRVPDGEVESAWRDLARRYGGERALTETLRRQGASSRQARAEIVRMLTIRKTFDQAVTRGCGVSREEAAAFYQANPARFVEPEQLRIQAVTVTVDPSSGSSQWTAARERAAEALRQLRAGVPFERIVSEYSTDPTRDRGGDLGYVHRGSLTPQFEDAARALTVGQPSDVIESLYGYHIIRIVEVRPPQQRSFDEVRAALEQDLTTTRCGERRTAWIAGLRANARVTVGDQP